MLSRILSLHCGKRSRSVSPRQKFATKQTKLILRMPTFRIRKTDRGLKPLSLYESAASEVALGKSVRGAAMTHGLCHVTLHRFIKRKETVPDSPTLCPGYRPVNKVFTAEQETILSEYILRTADLYYDLSPKEVRKLAYELAKDHNCKHPQSWADHGVAGVDWLNGFLKRHPSISLRRPQVRNSLEEEQEKSPLSVVFAEKEVKYIKEMKYTKEKEDEEEEELNSPEEQNETPSSKVKQGVSAEEGTNVKRKRKKCTKECEDEGEEEEAFYIVCLESY